MLGSVISPSQPHRFPGPQRCRLFIELNSRVVAGGDVGKGQGRSMCDGLSLASNLSKCMIEINCHE